MGRIVALVIIRAATMAGVLVVSGCGSLPGPRAALGPGSIVRGRGLYNEVIAYTNSEQTLDLIVRARYGEPWGLLSVASVTANLKVTATTEGQFGIGPSSNFKGNLVPLAAGLAYEDSPTISYTPVQGERYAKRILSPIELDVLVLLLSTERDAHKAMSVLMRQVNGLRNSMADPPAARAAFEESIGLLARLQDSGQAAWISKPNSPDAMALVIHGYARGNLATVRKLLRMWELPESLARQRRDIVLPVRLAFGSAPTPCLNVETRSVFDLIQIAATTVEVPAEDVELGLPDPGLDALSSPEGFLKIRSSRNRPSSNVLVAVQHRGWWFYIPANDGPSKLAFRLLQTLITMHLVEASPQSSPTLTIPVK